MEGDGGDGVKNRVTGGIAMRQFPKNRSWPGESGASKKPEKLPKPGFYGNGPIPPFTPPGLEMQARQAIALADYILRPYRDSGLIEDRKPARGWT